MSRTKLAALTFAVLAFNLCGAEKLPKADRIPAPPTPEQAVLIREGIALHDQRKYDLAAGKYKEVLAQNPWEVTALHELALTYFESKDYEGALATARLGAQCKSRGLPGFYAMIGNALDELGKTGDAIATYRAAIKQYPDIATLHSNLAVTLRRAAKQREAKAALERALECDPGHVRSHEVLGTIYQEAGYRIPAIMAYSRFLMLAGGSARAAQILPAVLGLLAQGAAKGKGANEITIFMPDTSKAKKDEGDFTGVEMMMSIVIGADLIELPGKEKTQPKSDFDKIASLYASMGEALDASKPKGGFAATYYAPYFATIADAQHTEALAACILEAGQAAAASEWAKANAGKMQAFLEWSKAYRWPAK